VTHIPNPAFETCPNCGGGGTTPHWIECPTRLALKCYYCRESVPRLAHTQHFEVLQALIDSSVQGIWDAFVHMKSPGKSRRSGREKQLPPDAVFDEDGFAVVCDRCFVKEIAEAIV